MLLETHFPVNNLPCDAHNALLDSSMASWQDVPQNTSQNARCASDAAMEIIRTYSTQKLRDELEKFGDRPGPITISTRQVYERRLHQLRLDPSLARVTPTTTG